MSDGLIIWVNGDMSEQIIDFNGQYVLVRISDKQKILLGKTLEEAEEKLKEMGRDDIIAQLK
ncbi:MAG TPA: hypothetical protein PKA28_11040 [Methylomusa anaerophila]|uniref:Uncharacterized protein n=1 Tax=Methylomusa anaerophila TaxID=1930071 RepID=A0A348AJ46_9FIRM|nr:hypothetical protein [Methylomusa anaerophila]BBB91094.1 hypothetical protein MAMMFC1_01762 [Methylomusa anaerophila]HML88971.1 hypothetical protein [Methylomusa anaerophila]